MTQNSYRGNTRPYGNPGRNAPVPPQTSTTANPAARIPAFEVVDIRLLDGSNLKALASVKFGPVVAHKCRLIQVDGQAAFSSVPQEQWTDAEGRKKWAPLLSIPKEWQPAFTEAILSAYEKARAEAVGGGHDDEFPA